MQAESEQMNGSSSWEPMFLQCIVFTVQPALNIEQNWWKDLTGEDPQESTKKKQERTEQGIFQGRVLAVSTEILRATWTMAPQFDPESLLDNPAPTLGNAIQAVNDFVQIMSKWFPKAPPVKRIAFTGRMLHRADDHISCYQILSRYLPKVQIDPQSTELLYRINRKRFSRAHIPGLKINRLATWSAIRAVTQSTSQLPGQIKSQLALTPTTVYAVMVELDINTPVEFEGELPNESLGSLFGELAEMGMELTTKGDVE